MCSFALAVPLARQVFCRELFYQLMAALYEIDADEAEEELENELMADEELARDDSEEEAGTHPHDAMVARLEDGADSLETHDTAHASRISFEAGAAAAAPPASPPLGGGGTPPPPSWVSRLATPSAAQGREAGLDGTRASGAL
jgi:hypothetical protein